MVTIKLSGANHSRPINSAGFTLIEALVVVAISAILASIAVPSFQSFILGQRVKAATSDLYSALIMARSEAMKRNTTATVTQATGGWVNGWTVASGGATQITQGAEAKVTIAEINGGLTSVTYSWTGRPNTASSDAEFVVSAPGIAARCITLTLSGLPRMATDTDGDATNGC